ncbi:O-fucosyltransferase family protein isoform X2 [Wolffia australiana]
MRRDFCDGIGISRLLNATLVLPKFEAAAYWNESSGFADVFDVDYFLENVKGFVHVVKELPEEISSKEPVKVDCSKRSGQFDYVEKVLPILLQHRYISITPAMSQRRDRYPTPSKAALCHACYNALRLNQDLEKKGRELLNLMPKPFLSLHLRFEPDMVAYSRCQYDGLSTAAAAAIDAVRGTRQPLSGAAAVTWRERGKCPLTPNETVFILQSLGIPTTTPIYLAAGDGILELHALTCVYPHVYTKSSLLGQEDSDEMGGNTKAALDYFVSTHSDAYVATFFGNMDKMVAAARAVLGLPKTLFLNRKAFASATARGLHGVGLAREVWSAHEADFAMGRGSALPDCFCEVKL